MDHYTLSFRQMAGGGVDLTVDLRELDYLIAQGLVEVRALKIRSALLPELAKLYETQTEKERTPSE